MAKGRSLIRRNDVLLTRLAAIQAAYVHRVRQLPQEVYKDSKAHQDSLPGAPEQWITQQ